MSRCRVIVGVLSIGLALLYLESCASVSKMERKPIDSGFSIGLGAGIAEASSAARETFEDEGFKLLSVRPAADGSTVILAVLPSSFQSWGQYLRVVLIPLNESSVMIRVHNVRRLESNGSEILEPVRKRIILGINARLADGRRKGAGL
jgi:hypothetical protein